MLIMCTLEVLLKFLEYNASIFFNFIKFILGNVLIVFYYKYVRLFIFLYCFIFRMFVCIYYLISFLNVKIVNPVVSRYIEQNFN